MTDVDFESKLRELLAKRLLFVEFCKEIKKLAKMAWRDEKNTENASLSKWLCNLKDKKEFDFGVLPFEMLIEAIEAYRLEDIEDFEKNKEEIINVSNTVAKIVGTPIKIGLSTIANGGYGLFATEDIARNVAVTAYGGAKFDGDFSTGGDYVIQVDEKNSIDGAIGFRLGEMARWANGLPSETENWICSEKNNATFGKNPHDKNKPYLITKTHVAAGSEIFVDYGPHYQWHQLGYIKKTTI